MKCHFCAKAPGPSAGLFAAECKICSPYAAHQGQQFFFCTTCFEDRRITRPAQLVDTKKLLAVHKPLDPHALTLFSFEEVEPCKPSPTKGTQCCDGHRLLTMLYHDVPVVKAAVDDPTPVFYGVAHFRSHVNLLVHAFSGHTFGPLYPHSVHALCLLVIFARAFGRRQAEQQGSPRHGCVLAGKFLRGHHALLTNYYRNDDVKGRGANDLLFDHIPDPGALVDHDGKVGFVRLAELVAGDDTLQLYIHGHHYRRVDPSMAKPGALLMGERGHIDLPTAVERLTDLAHATGLGPGVIFSLCMTIFQMETALYHRATHEAHHDQLAQGGFQVAESYTTHSPAFHDFLWGVAKPKFEVSPGGFPMTQGARELFDALQYEVEHGPPPPDPPKPKGKPAPQGPSAPRGAQPPGLHAVALRDVDHQIKPPGLDPISDSQYQFLRQYVRYHEESPGEGRSIGTNIVPALDTVPCAHEVIDYIASYLDGTFAFPVANGPADARALLEQVLAWIYRTACLTLTFNPFEWFVADQSNRYPAAAWREYRHTFMLEQPLVGDAELVGADAGGGLHTYTKKASYVAERPDQYNRWRREKDERVTEYRVANPAELPVYGALNFDFPMTLGWIGDRWIRAGYHYYGTAHFVLDRSTYRRTLFTVESEGRAYRNLVLVVADLVACKEKRHILHDVIAQAVDPGGTTLYTRYPLSSEHDRFHVAGDFVEAMVFGQVRFQEDVSSLVMPPPLREEARAEIAGDLGTTPSTLGWRTTLFGKAIRDHIRKLDWGVGGANYDAIMGTTAAEWSQPQNAARIGDFYAGRVPFTMLHPVFAKLGKARCYWLGEFVRKNQDVDPKSFAHADLPVSLAKSLTAEELGVLAGYPSIAMFADAQDFCTRNGVTLLSYDMYSPHHAVTYAEKSELPLPARGNAPVVAPTVPPFVQSLTNTNV